MVGFENFKTGVKEKIEELLFSGNWGSAQAVDISINAPHAKEQAAALEMWVGQLVQSQAEKVDRQGSDKGYAHGFCILNFKNGSVGRISYASAPITDRIILRIYATAGEIRANGISGEIKTYKQIPNYEGDDASV